MCNLFFHHISFPFRSFVHILTFRKIQYMLRKTGVKVHWNFECVWIFNRCNLDVAIRLLVRSQNRERCMASAYDELSCLSIILLNVFFSSLKNTVLLLSCVGQDRYCIFCVLLKIYTMHCVQHTHTHTLSLVENVLIVAARLEQQAHRLLKNIL